MTSPVQSVSFNNSENWIGAGSKSGVFKVFDLEENKGWYMFVYARFKLDEAMYAHTHTHTHSCPFH